MTKKLRILVVFAIVAIAAMTALAQPAAVNMTAPITTKTIPSSFIVPISVGDVSSFGIIAYEFNVAYNPAIIDPFGPNFGCSTLGTISGTAGLSVTCNVVPDGLLRISVSGSTPLTGSGTLLALNFQTDPTALSGNVSPLNFQSVRFFNGSGEVVSSATNGSVTLLVPTAAGVGVGGRAAGPDGRPIANAIVTISDGNGLVRVARTSPFGYYRVENLPAGGAYIVTVVSKQHDFAPRILLLADEIADFDLVSDN